MKNFFSSLFATLTALVIFCVGGFLFCLLLFGAIAAANGKKPVVVTKGSYLVFDLSTNIQDRPEQREGLDQFMEALGGDVDRSLQLRAATRAIQAAAKDPDIAGIYLYGHLEPVGYGSGFAALKELRDALVAFKASGKPIQAYCDEMTVRDYYVASAASELTMDPYGALFLPGLATQPMFYTGAFEKFGIGVQVTRVGKYKSYVEPYIRKDMSPENRAQTGKLLDDLWAEIVTTIEQARGLKPGTLQGAVDSEGFFRAETAQKFKLVDRVAYLDTVLEDLKAATGRRGNQAFRQVALGDYADLISGDGLVARRSDGGKLEYLPSGSDRIAIVYAEGEIVDGVGPDEDYVYGEKLARQLRELRLDNKVKAVVLRVNSPGGSVTASEEIQRELRLLKKTKPYVVSMGTVAASGGYWISTFADRIYAEPNTITGSIGVFGMFLNFQGLATDKLGLTFDTVKTGKFADILSVSRPKTEEELALFQQTVDWVYEQFVGKVSESRKLEPAVVREIAQGRVWSGSEAKNLGLVDEIGGLDAAVKFAATRAGLGENFHVAEYPRKKRFAEALTEALEGRRHDYSRAGALGAFLGQAMSELDGLKRLNDPRGLYARLPFDLGMN
jgi:protease IV